MKMLPSEEKAEQVRFENFFKKILSNEALNYEKEINNRSKNLILFSELPEHIVANLSTTDEYFASEQIFHVAGEIVVVKDFRLAEALRRLTQEQRDIILLDFYLGVTDEEIGKKLNILRGKIQRKRTSTLKKLKIQMEETEDEEKEKNR